jgi:hypothetical protein
MQGVSLHMIVLQVYCLHFHGGKLPWVVLHRSKYSLLNSNYFFHWFTDGALHFESIFICNLKISSLTLNTTFQTKFLTKGEVQILLIVFTSRRPDNHINEHGCLWVIVFPSFPLVLHISFHIFSIKLIRKDFCLLKILQSIH